MKFKELTAGAMRECVDLYRVQKQPDGGGGYKRVPQPLQLNLRVAWEDRTPSTTVQGAQQAPQLDAEAGMPKSVEVRPDDWVVQAGYVYRVIRPRTRAGYRWQIVALEYRDVWDPAEEGLQT